MYKPEEKHNGCVNPKQKKNCGEYHDVQPVFRKLKETVILYIYFLLSIIIIHYFTYIGYYSFIPSLLFFIHLQPCFKTAFCFIECMVQKGALFLYLVVLKLQADSRVPPSLKPQFKPCVQMM